MGEFAFLFSSRSVPEPLASHTLQCACWFGSTAEKGTAKMDTIYMSINSQWPQWAALVFSGNILITLQDYRETLAF